MHLLNHYFPELTDLQVERFSKLDELYKHWNAQINVISRKDIEHLYEHHVLHSLAIAKVIRFAKGTQIVDVGTGGGLPGIPLGILCPEAKFHLVDSTAKKIKVVQEVIQALGLENVTTQQVRSNELKRKFDFVTGRAVTEFPKFVEQVRHLIHSKDKNGLPNGILYLKGGSVQGDIQTFRKQASVYELEKYFEEPFFQTKKLIYMSS